MGVRMRWVLLGAAIACSGARPDHGPISTPVCEGSPLVGAAAVQRFADLGCIEVTGTLSISGDDVTRISLPTVTKIENLDIETGTQVDLPALATVTGSLRVYDAPLGFLSLPSLTAAGDVTIAYNLLRVVDLSSLSTARTLAIAYNAISTLDLSSLREVTGSSCQYEGCFGLIVTGEWLTVLDLPALTTATAGIHVDFVEASVRAPVLETVGTLYLQYVGRGYDMLEFPALREASAIILEDTEAYELALPSLTDIHGISDGSGLRLWLNRYLDRVELPALRSTRSLDVSINAQLGSVVAPALASVPQDFIVGSNVSYPNCAALALLAQLASPPATVTVSDNDMTATCAP